MCSLDRAEQERRRRGEAEPQQAGVRRADLDHLQDFELAPAEGEPVIPKCFPSSFEETTLQDELARPGATHVVLAGAATNWCIRATAYGALDRGYDLTLVADAHTTFPIESSDARVVEADGVARELHAVMARVSYPGRTIAVAAAGEVGFGAGAYEADGGGLGAGGAVRG